MGVLATIFPLSVSGMFFIAGGFLAGQGKWAVGAGTVLTGLWVVPLGMKYWPQVQQFFQSL